MTKELALSRDALTNVFWREVANATQFLNHQVVRLSVETASLGKERHVMTEIFSISMAVMGIVNFTIFQNILVMMKSQPLVVMISKSPLLNQGRQWI